jgi:vancomycin permeability regulator SanA
MDNEKLSKNVSHIVEQNNNKRAVTTVTKLVGKIFTRMIQIIFIASFVTLVLLVTFPLFVYYEYRQKIYIDVSAVEQHDIAIVFGAAAYGVDLPSPPLKDRLDVAAALYKDGKIKKIIVSGDNSSEYYNEPLTMFNTLVKLDVNAEDIIQDPAGFRTYDTCVRAKKVFGVNQALLISQGYHLPRALFTCHSVGIDAAGIYSTGDFSTYYNRWYSLREILAMYNAFVDIFISPPAVVISEPRPIDIKN